MNDDPDLLADFHGQARLFPLPNLVLFPNVVQGLHIFEPRYRQLMADALGSNQFITLVLLKPGWEDDYDNSPAIETVGCLGQIIWHEKLADGRYNLRLRGLARLRLIEEVASDRLYRQARAEIMTELSPSDLHRLTTLRRALADAVLPRFAPEGPAHHQLQELFDGDLPLGHICDVLSYALPLPLDLKQSLLAEPHADIRAELMTQALQISAARADRKFPPDFSAN